MKKFLIILCLAVLSLSVPAIAEQGVVIPITVFREFFSIERDNITTASVNIPFSFVNGAVGRKILVETPSTNTDDICITWFDSGTAVCPAANTSGNQRLKPGTSLFVDNLATLSVSVIAASGTQVFQVTAWR